MTGTRGSTPEKTSQLKTYRVSLHLEQTIVADDEEVALGIFWDDFMRNQAEEENAAVEEVG